VLFNTYEYAVFIILVFAIYWQLLSNHLRTQNLFLITASYVFYGWWDWRFLSLIVLSSIVDFTVGFFLGKANLLRARRVLLASSIIFNIGMLGVFKYYNFFIDSFIRLFDLVGVNTNIVSLQIILPVGISFYTFQTLGYTIDVFNRKIKPSDNVIEYFAYVSFFPQLVAGPIERAGNLLPQFSQLRKFDYSLAVDGLRQILWGLFKKIVIADNCAIYANDIFGNYTEYSGSVLLVGAVYFAFQIYGDFSGYSDIAIGSAKLFGFRLMRNFSYPYFSRDIAEFWRRWHISLSTWFRDYVYIPLGGNRGNTIFRIRNVFVIFVVSGLWHGANWTFVIWGLFHSMLFIPLMVRGRNRVNLDSIAQNRILPTLFEVINIIKTFILTTIGWIIFRSESIFHFLDYFRYMFSRTFFAIPRGVGLTSMIFVISILLIVEWIQRKNNHGLSLENLKPRIGRWTAYYAVAIIIALFNNTPQTFIYFQF